MRILPACLLVAGLCTVGCKDPNSTPASPSEETKPSGEAKGNPKEILAALRQLGAAFHKFEVKHGHLPAAAILGKDGKPLLSWRVAILPFIDQDELYKQFHLDEPWDSENNKKLLERMPAEYADPQIKCEPGRTVYQAVVGPGLAFEGNKGLKLASMLDGSR